MFGALALVALIATAGAYVSEFTEEGFQRLYPHHPNPVKAKFIKSNTRLTLGKRKTKENYALTLYPHEVLDVPPDHLDMCGKYHGLYLTDNQDVFCRISHVSLVTNSPDSDDEQNFYVSLFFEEGFLGPLRLNIPVFKLAHDALNYNDYNALDEQLQHEFSSENRVGRINLEEELEIGGFPCDIVDGKPFTIGFEEINLLLNYGIFKSTFSAADTNSYVTRPILLSAEDIDSFIEVIIHIDDMEYTFSWQ